MQTTAIPIAEIFASRQGEGAQVGRSVVFVRLAGCNLACGWCDTDFQATRTPTAQEIFDEVKSYNLDSVILTGGEPLASTAWRELAQLFKSAGLWLGLETNGTFALTPDEAALFDYIATSPKTPPLLTRANEVRLVADGVLTSERCRTLRNTIRAEHYFISPCDRQGHFCYEEALELLGELNKDNPQPLWQLSLQVHKLAGFR